MHACVRAIVLWNMRVPLKLVHSGFTSRVSCMAAKWKSQHFLLKLLCPCEMLWRRRRRKSFRKKRKQINKIKLPFAFRMIKSELLWVCWFKNRYSISSSSIFIVRHWRNATAQILTQIISLAFLSPVYPISFSWILGCAVWHYLPFAVSKLFILVNVFEEEDFVFTFTLAAFYLNVILKM